MELYKEAGSFFFLWTSWIREHWLFVFFLSRFSHWILFTSSGAHSHLPVCLPSLPRKSDKTLGEVCRAVTACSNEWGRAVDTLEELLEVRERPGLTLSYLRRLKGKGGAGVIRRLAWCQTWVQIYKGLDSLSVACSQSKIGLLREAPWRCLVSVQPESAVNGPATKTLSKSERHNKSFLISIFVFWCWF